MSANWQNGCGCWNTMGASPCPVHGPFETTTTSALAPMTDKSPVPADARLADAVKRGRNAAAISAKGSSGCDAFRLYGKTTTADRELVRLADAMDEALVALAARETRIEAALAYLTDWGNFTSDVRAILDGSATYKDGVFATVAALTGEGT